MHEEVMAAAACSTCGLPGQFFVTGTDTGVGKTFISALLMMLLDASYWKPIQSGRDPYADSDFIQQFTQLPESSFFPEGYKLSEPLSPHAAARIDGITIDINTLSLPPLESQRRHLIVEGAGGVLVPINDSMLVADLIAHYKIPAIVVTRTTLGTINHTLLTIEALRRRSIPIAGVVMNGPDNPSNRASIEKYGNVPVLFHVPHLPLTPTSGQGEETLLQLSRCGYLPLRSCNPAYQSGSLSSSEETFIAASAPAQLMKARY